MAREIDQLTLDHTDALLHEIAAVHSTLDLRALRFVDPFGLLLLQLALLERADREEPVRLLWPHSGSVSRWMRAMGLRTRKETPPPVHAPESAMQPITRIEDEEGIGQVVDGFHHRLADRYPLTASSRRALVAVLIELFQNIPHHSNATAAVEDPHGIAAMQDYDGAIFVAVADRGIGLAASLGLRDGYAGLSDADALDLIFHRGISRFSDPGRGGELRRIAELVRSWDGTFAVRTGNAMYQFDPYGGDTSIVQEFPGVQLALCFPDRAFL